MEELVCRKEIMKLNLPSELLREVLTYCVWKRPQRTSFWYIVASHFDTNGFTRAKEIDQSLHYLASDEYDDCFYIFKETREDRLDCFRHIENNRTV